MRMLANVLLFVTLTGCGQSEFSKTNDESKPASLIARIASLELKTDKYLAEKRQTESGLTGRIGNTITELKAIGLEVDFEASPLLFAVEKAEALVAANVPEWRANKNAGLSQRVGNIETALTKLTSDYNQKKGGLVLRVEVLKAKFTALNVALTNTSGLLPTVEEMEKKLGTIETK